MSQRKRMKKKLSIEYRSLFFEVVKKSKITFKWWINCCLPAILIILFFKFGNESIFRLFWFLTLFIFIASNMLSLQNPTIHIIVIKLKKKKNFLLKLDFSSVWSSTWLILQSTIKLSFFLFSRTIYFSASSIDFEIPKSSCFYFCKTLSFDMKLFAEIYFWTCNDTYIYIFFFF